MKTDKMIQIGILVKNIEEAARKWAGFLGVTMPEISCTEGYEASGAVYRGSPCDGRIYQAVFEFGNIQLELISPADDTPSFWKECLDRDGEGLHHLALYTDTIDRDIRELTEKGYGLLQKGSWRDTPRDGIYAYLDTAQELKCTIELLDFCTDKKG